MKGWISAVMAVTFLSGASTGYLLAPTPPPAPKTWIDGAIEQLRQEGVPEAGLAEAREVYEGFEAKVLEIKKNVETIIGGRLEFARKEAERRIQEIRTRGK